MADEKKEENMSDSTKNTTTAKPSGGNSKNMIKIAAIGGVVFLFVGILIAVGGYIMFLRPANVESVCENFYQIYESELEETLGEDMSREEIEESLGLTKEECLDEEQKSRDDSDAGILTIVEVSRCQADADSLKGFIDCAEDADDVGEK